MHLFSLVILVLSMSFLLSSCESKKAKESRLSADESRLEYSGNLIDINSASVEELEKLPSIGRKTAERIVEHRSNYGRFRRVEHIILVRGMSDAKFRKIRQFIEAR